MCSGFYKNIIYDLIIKHMPWSQEDINRLLLLEIGWKKKTGILGKITSDPTKSLL